MSAWSNRTNSPIFSKRIGTSALEGTFANLTELLAAEAVSVEWDDPSIPSNVREVMNYTRSADAAFDWITRGLRCALVQLDGLELVNDVGQVPTIDRCLGKL